MKKTGGADASLITTEHDVSAIPSRFVIEHLYNPASFTVDFKYFSVLSSPFVFIDITSLLSISLSSIDHFTFGLGFPS